MKKIAIYLLVLLSVVTLFVACNHDGGVPTANIKVTFLKSMGGEERGSVTIKVPRLEWGSLFDENKTFTCTFDSATTPTDITFYFGHVSGLSKVLIRNKANSTKYSYISTTATSMIEIFEDDVIPSNIEVYSFDQRLF